MRKGKELEWEQNQIYLALEYFVTYFWLDVIAIMPFVISIFIEKMPRMWLVLRFSRLSRIKRIL
jgi:hypothetical protein